MRRTPVVWRAAFILFIQATIFLSRADIVHVHHPAGKTAQLACPTTGSGSSVKWRRVGGILSGGAWSDEFGTLHLPGQVADTGVYECSTSSGKESVSARIKVTFFPYDDPSKKPIPVSVRNGSRVKLDCCQGGAPHLRSRVFWFKGDSKPLPTHARVKGEGSLVLTNVRQGATYHCIIPLQYKTCVPTHSTFHVHIIGPPTLVTGPKNQTVVSGGDVVLSCQFKGRPTPKVHWTKGNGKENHTLSFVGPVLKIANVTHKDTGFYSCTGSNQEGQLASAPAHVKVLHTPDPPKAMQHMAFTNGSVLLCWRQPLRHPHVSSYSVSYKECCAALEWTTVNVTAGEHRKTQWLLTGLTPGWNYTVHVVAHSSTHRHSAPLAFNFTTPAADGPDLDLLFIELDNASSVIIHDVKAVKGSDLNDSLSIDDIIHDVEQFPHQQSSSFPAVLAIAVPTISIAVCLLVLAATIGGAVVAVRRRRYRSYDLTSQKLSYQKLPHVFVHGKVKRVPPRWRKLLDRKTEGSLVDGSDIDLTFRSTDKGDTQYDNGSEGELCANEEEALLKTSQSS